MATLKIVYAQLDDASEYARTVAKKCQDYYDELGTKCYNAIPALPESPLSEKNHRTDDAQYYVQKKREKLLKKKTSFNNYADRINEFKNNTQQADARVAKSVNSSQKKFYEDHPRLSGDGWAAFFANIAVECPVIGYLLDKAGEKLKFVNDVQNALRYWYEVKGGKKVIDTALAIGELVLAVVAVIGAIVTPAGWFLAACAIIGGIIGVIDAITNLSFQIVADTQKDPAWANYYSNIDDSSTFLRKTTFRGNARWFNKYSGALATGIDVTKAICSAVDIGNSAYKKSGLGDLFDTTAPVKRTNEKYKKFDFSKFKSTMSSAAGRADVKKTLKTTMKKNLKKYTGKNNWKKNWKRLVFGHNNGSWTQKWDRALHSQNTTKAQRVDKIYKAAKSDFDTFKSAIDVVKFGNEAFRGDVTPKSVIDAIDSGYSMRSKSDGCIEKILDKKDIKGDIIELYKTNGEPQKVAELGLKKLVG